MVVPVQDSGITESIQQRSLIMAKMPLFLFLTGFGITDGYNNVGRPQRWVDDTADWCTLA